MRRLEFALYGAGIALLAFFAVVRVDAALGRKTALSDFESARAAAAAAAAPAPEKESEKELARPGLSQTLSAFDSPDRSMWSADRMRGFDASMAQHFAAAPLAILRIPGIELEVPVLAGTDALALNRGVGHIEGTPRPGEPGNVGIAGHRDGFFRGLKDVTANDLLEVESLTGTVRYRVESITIVSPDRVDVLAPTALPVVTLVTCYPFYYVGNAPKRYIVRAVLDQSDAPQIAERRIRTP